MLRQHLRTIAVSWRLFGPGKVFFGQLLAEPLMKLFNWTTLELDPVLFPRIASCRVERPLFIIGHPRSGTTFLHHLLTQAEGVAPFQAWHIFFPAITARKLVKPLIDLAIRRGKAEVMPEWTGHRMMLDQPEEEEMLFLQNDDTQFVAAGLLGFDDRDYPELRFHDQQPREHRLRSMRFLDGCFRRHLVYTGMTRIVAQTHFSTHRLQTILEYYPDARFVYLVRNPLQVVPSFLSLLHKSMAFRWGADRLPPEVWSRYYLRRYQASIDLHRYFHDLWLTGAIPPGRVLIIRYDDLISDLTSIVTKIAAFAGLELTPALQAQLADRAVNQGRYQRRHEVMPLEAFGLTEARIREDFAFVLREFGWYQPDSDRNGGRQAYRERHGH
ncbi:MAG: sulfotransferase [Thermodesulfobacteriota bacterium]